MSFNFNSLWLDWRAKVPDGTPNPKNAYHLVLLKEICLKQGIDIDIIDKVILVLEAEEKIPDETPIKYKLKNKDGEMEDKETTYGSAIQRDKEHPAYIAAKALQSDGDDEEEKEPTKQTKIKVNPYDKKEDDKEGGEEDKEQKPKGTPVEKKLSSAVKKGAAKTIEKVDNVIKELEGELETPLTEDERANKQGEIDRLKILKKNWTKLTDAETEEEQEEAVREMVENGLLARNSPGSSNRKIYFTEMVSGMGAKDGMMTQKGTPGDGNSFSQLISDIIDSGGMEGEVGLRNTSAARTLAKVSGDHNEAGVCAFLDPSELNEENYRKTQDSYASLGGDERRANKQNQAAAEKVKDYLSKMDPPCDVEKAEAMGHLGNKEIKLKYNIDPKKNPTDFFVYCKDGRRKGISAKIYSNPKSITMKNSGTKKAGSDYLDDPSIDEKLDSLKQKYNIGNNPTDKEKSAFKTEYLKLWSDSMEELSKTPEGQQKLTRMWNEVHGCGEDVATLITNKKTGEVKLHDPDHYCDPEGPLEVIQDKTKIMVKFGKDDEWTEMVCKTEKNGSVKLLFNHHSKKA
jgi:hypothetical protein